MGLIKDCPSSTQNNSQGISFLASKGVNATYLLNQGAHKTSKTHALKENELNALKEMINPVQSYGYNLDVSKGQFIEPKTIMRILANQRLKLRFTGKRKRSVEYYDTYNSYFNKYGHRGGRLTRSLLKTYLRKMKDMVDKVNSRAKVQSPKIRNNNPVEPKNHTNKPGRQNGIGQRVETNGKFSKTYHRWLPYWNGVHRLHNKVDSEPPKCSNEISLTHMNAIKLFMLVQRLHILDGGMSTNYMAVCDLLADVLGNYSMPRDHSCMTTICPQTNLVFRIGKSISLTEAEEEAVLPREVHATHGKNSTLKVFKLLLPADQEAADSRLKALKKSKRTDKRPTWELEAQIRIGKTTSLGEGERNTEVEIHGHCFLIQQVSSSFCPLLDTSIIDSSSPKQYPPPCQESFYYNFQPTTSHTTAEHSFPLKWVMSTAPVPNQIQPDAFFDDSLPG
ncbi:hypothetical protein Tco_0278134 [Tanacetum coccineum]